MPRSHWGFFRDALPDRAGSLAGRHAIASGCGEWLADRWPEPRVALALVGGNLGFWGRADALDPAKLGAVVERGLETWERILLDVEGDFEPPARAALATAQRWPRVCYALDAPPPVRPQPAGAEIGRLTAADGAALARLSPPLRWIADPWDGPDRLAASGLAWGAYAEGELVSVASVFFVGERTDELAVVTEPGFRARGLSTACAARAAAHVLAGGRRVGWSTSRDNLASQRVATRLGFRRERDTFLLVAGRPITAQS